MHNSVTEAVSRLLTGPRIAFRFALANAMFVLLVAKELVVKTVDE